MSTKSFALEPGAPPDLTLTWDGHFKNLRVLHANGEVGRFSDKASLLKGGTFTLSDGSIVEVRLDESFMGRRLVVLRNGSPVPGSATDPRQQVKQAGYAAYVVGAFNIVVGIIATASDWSALTNLGVGIGNIAAGVLYAVLGFFILRGSAIAAGAAVGLYTLDAIASTALLAAAGTSPNALGILFRILIIGILWRGFSAARKLKTG